jgi:hypothetical protein
MVVARGNKTDFEKVEIDSWINGSIAEVQERLNENKKFKNKETGEDEVRSAQEVRFVFSLDGYSFKHYSRWMTISTHKESNLFKKYLSKLILDAKAGEDIDLDQLIGMRVKTMWDNDEWNGQVYQNIVQIKPL